MYQSGSQTDLVAVGGITACCCGTQLALGQLMLQCFTQRNGRITGAGDTHCLIDIASAGQRVTDCAAKAGCRAAERFNFRRVVMGFIFKHEQPRLFLAVHGCVNADGAGIDFLTHINIRQVAALLEHLCTGGTDIHQGNRTLCSLFLAIDFDTASQITLIRCLDHRVFDIAAVNLGQEGGMTAMVRPVGVNHPYFGDGRITLFLTGKIALQELQVIQLHCQTQAGTHFLQRGCIHGDKAGYGIHLCGDCVIGSQCFRLFLGSLSGIHRVNQIATYFIQIRIGQLAAQHIDMGCRYLRTFSLGHQLDTLGTGIRTLVILTRQRFHCQNPVITLRHRILLIIAIVYHRFGEHDVLCLRIGFRINAFHIVTAQLTHIGQCRNFQQFPHAAAQRLGRTVESTALFSITS